MKQKMKVRERAMKKIWLSLLAAGVVLTACSAGGTKSKEDVKIGVIQYTEHPALDKANKGFMKVLMKAGYQKKNIDFQNAQTDPSNCETIANKFVNDGKDLIYAIATPAAQAVKSKTNDIPVLISAVTDPAKAGLVDSNKKPNSNVTGVSDLNPVEDQINLLHELLPEAKKVAVMYCSSEDNSIVQAKLATKALKAMGLEVKEATVSESNQIQSVTESLIGKVDAIYIPTDNLLAEGISAVTGVANENKIPVIPGEESMTRGGGLATYSIDYEKLGEMAGQMALKILSGKANPQDMPIQYQSKKSLQVVINQGVATRLGIQVPAELLQKAKVIE